VTGTVRVIVQRERVWSVRTCSPSFAESLGWGWCDADAVELSCSLEATLFFSAPSVLRGWALAGADGSDVRVIDRDGDHCGDAIVSTLRPSERVTVVERDTNADGHPEARVVTEQLPCGGHGCPQHVTLSCDLDSDGQIDHVHACEAGASCATAEAHCSSGDRRALEAMREPTRSRAPLATPTHVPSRIFGEEVCEPQLEVTGDQIVGRPCP
jgi:hypothetical protein